MLKLSKKCEYAILALQYLADKRDELIPAKAIAEELSVSFEFLAKTLQVLYRKDIVISVKGTKGGYTLAREPQDISLGEVLEALDARPELIDCHSGDHESCERYDVCKIKDPMQIIHGKILEIFDNTTVEDLLIKNSAKEKMQKTIPILEEA
ncbi:MAG: Rrf2 family transcriptional regulator [Candidatus Kapaibacteriales bacterium]